MVYNFGMRISRDPILKRKLNAAIQICRHWPKRFTEFKPNSAVEDNCFSVYLATNERCEYFPKMTSFEDKDVLSVTGSGDQAFNAVYFGANTVETFDINLLTFMFFDLKQAALMKLTRKEFLEFYDECDLFPRPLYNKVCDSLSPQTKAFFDGLFAYVEKAPDKDMYLKNLSKTSFVLYELVEEFPQVQKNIMANNPYLASHKTYQETKKRLALLKQPIAQKFCSAHELAENFQPKDVIILSNILRYYFEGFYSEQYQPRSMQKFKAEKVVASALDILKDSGVISLLYEHPHRPSHEERLRQNLGINLQSLSVIDEEYNVPAQVLYAYKEDIQTSPGISVKQLFQ